MSNQGPKQPFNLSWIGLKKQSSSKRGRVISSGTEFSDRAGKNYVRTNSGQIVRVTPK